MLARIPTLAAALLVATQLGWAGDASNPEITDPPGDAGAAASFGDITAAWLEERGPNVVGTLRLAQLPEQPIGDTYMLLADVNGTTYAWGLFRSSIPTDFYWYGTWQRGSGPAGPLEQGEGQLAPGSPGTVTFSIPRAYLGATNGTVLAKLTAVTEVCLCGGVGPVALPQQQGLTETVFDTAEGADYTVVGVGPAVGNATSPAPSPAPPAALDATASPPGDTSAAPDRPTPGAEAALAALAVGAASLAAGLRRRR
ncbi:MAG TPA: hypothetical protein VGR28_07535 [Candidatus Thermoplasmatota archaeon]|jgi:hypothetical protein|nr:hypothetical protein [Candidatus Thermoplasmatota archaeon]